MQVQTPFAATARLPPLTNGIPATNTLERPRQQGVKEVIELRDRFRHSLYPGGGNRDTCAGIYAFNNAMRDVTFMTWPTAVFEALSERESKREAEWARIKPVVDEWVSVIDSFDDDD